ncbi:MAG: transcription termination factor NusA [Treponema sp.]|nr:transcription termination factor NusA [Treponema sp.]
MAIDISEAIFQLKQERGMSEEHILRTIEEILVTAYRRRYKIPEKRSASEKQESNLTNVVIRFSDDHYVSIFAKKKIVAEDEVVNSVFEISLEEAKKSNPEAEIGDELLIEIDPSGFDRAAIHSAKQTARHSIRNIQNSSLYDEFKAKVGEIIIGYYQRERNGDIYVNLGRVEGVLPKRFQSPREYFQGDDRIKALIYDVKKNASEVQVVLSRTHTDFVRAILTLEIPEIYDKVVDIHRIVRQPGYRTKIAVYSNKEDVDPVGACVGLKGVRIQSIIKEMEGEKIDILKYEMDPSLFIKNALSPAEVREVVILDEYKHQALAVVSDSQLSLAIGKQGNNVKLANKLVDWSIDVKTESQFAQMDIASESRRAVSELFGEVEEYSRISELPGVDPQVSAEVRDKGMDYIEDFIALSPQEQLEKFNLSHEQLDTLNKLIEEYVDIVEEEVGETPLEENEIEEYECPKCGVKITLDMTSCPGCGIGLSFEYEDEE